MLVLAGEIIGDIYSKSRVAATMERNVMAVDKNGGIIVDSAKVEQDSVARPLARHFEGSLVPRVDGLGSLYARQAAFQAERHQDLLRQRGVERRIAELIQARGIRVRPKSVQAAPLRWGELRSRVLWPRVCAYIVSPVGVEGRCLHRILGGRFVLQNLLLRMRGGKG